MSEVKVILSLETKQVAEQAAAAGKTMEKMAEESAKVMRDEAEKTETTVTSAAENSAKSVESVAKAADDAASGLGKTREAAQTASASVGTGMKSAAGSIKSAAGAASGVVSALGGVSPQLGLIGQAIAALVSGPIGLITAAATALIAIGTRAWDACTVSAEEYRKKLAAVLDLQSKVTDRIQDGMDASSRYLDRLEEIDRMETKGNAAKAEQARLLEILTKRYGDLGLKIDEATGMVEGLDAAREKIRRSDSSALADSLFEELKLKLGQLPEITGGDDRLRTILAGYDPDKVQRSYETVRGSMGPSVTREVLSGQKVSLREQLPLLQEYLKTAKITDGDTVDAVKARIDALADIVKTADEIKRLRSTGFRSEEAETTALAAATAKEGAGAPAAAPGPAAGTGGASAPSGPDPLKLLQDGVDGIVERYRLLRREQELIADGKEREAMIEKEIAGLRQRASMMGVELTQEQIESLESVIGSYYDYTQSLKPQPEPGKPDRSAELDAIAGKIAALYRPDAPAVITNSLIARGGSAAGFRMPDADRYARATSEATARLVELTEEQKALIAEGALI